MQISKSKAPQRVLMLAGLAESLVNFRGPLLDAFLAHGLEVHAAAPALLADQATCERLKGKGVVCHDAPLARTGMNPLKDLKSVFALRRLMRAVEPNYFLGYTIKPVIYGNLAAWLAGVPQRFALITGLGYAFMPGGGFKQRLVSRLAHVLYRMGLGRAHGVFFQNPDDEALFRQLGLLPAGKPSVVVNGSGVDVNEFAQAPLPQEAAGATSFLLIARLLGDKGIREYAEAARMVKAAYPQAVFRLVGYIDSNPNAISQAELDAWVAEGLIEFWGKLSDVRPAIAQSSVYVLPSYREGTPRSVLEALSMGRAVVTTDAPGCRETVVDGENGFLVPVQDAPALAVAMQRFLQEPALVARMGAKARQLAEEKYDVHKVNAQMLKGMGLL